MTPEIKALIKHLLCIIFHDWNEGESHGAGVIYMCNRCGDSFYKGSMD